MIQSLKIQQINKIMGGEEQIQKLERPWQFYPILKWQKGKVSF